MRDEETPADDFECLVDHGYVMLEEGAAAATGPLHFVSDWQTFDIRVGQSMVSLSLCVFLCVRVCVCVCVLRVCFIVLCMNKYVC